MRKLFLALVATATSASAIPPLPPPPPPAPPPRLLIVISVDQLSSDLFEEYRPHFTGGLARLASGTVFRNGYQSHASTETCPGHATILTGARPSTSGVIANSWIDQSAARPDKSIYCAEDESVQGSTFKRYTVSPAHLRGVTLGDQLKAALPAARNFAVAGKDRAAVMMGGRAVDQRWYWDGSRFSTDLGNAAVPATIAAVNAELDRRIAVPSAPLEPPPHCQSRAKPYTVAQGITVGAGRLARPAGDKRLFRYHPDFDGAVLVVAAGLIQEFQLGRGSATTDIISLGLSATDYVGHRYGTGGQEMCLQLAGLDWELGDFLSVLDRTGVDYAVALTSDHGAMDIPERLRDRGRPQAVRADPDLNSTAAGKQIGARLGLAGPILLGDTTWGDIWVDDALSPRDQARAQAAAVEYYGNHRQVAAVFTRAQLASAAEPSGDVVSWTLRERAKASFDPGRSGDLIVILKEFVSHIAVPEPDYVAGHGTAWDYDRRVPILFWRKGMAGAEREQPVETVDILPTLAAMIGLPPGNDAIDGKCLMGIQGIACPAR